MRYLVNSSEMRQCDRNTSEVFKVPSLLLMEQAALAACEEIERYGNKEERILIVCGTGNNGGDGLAIGRILFLKGYSADIVLIGDKKKGSEQNQKQLEILSAYGISVLKEIPLDKKYQMVIDAVFGVGLAGPIGGIYQSAVESMNCIDGWKVAIDIPSGVSADSGAVLGIAFRADMTITFAFDKVGMHLWPGNTCVGTIILKEIGITEHSFLGEKPFVRALEDCDLEQLAIRPSHSNKGTFGKVLLIAGSVNMAGAAILAGKSAYASGCGLVRILTPEENRVIIQTALPEAILTTYSPQEITAGWNTGENISLIEEVISWADVVVIGPGIGMSACSEMILKQVLKNAAVPVVLDADALNLLAKNRNLLQQLHPEIVITPHLGEMSRLTGEPVSLIQTKLLEIAKDFSDTYDVTCILKDERTVTCIPHEEAYLNLSGNAGMATAGSGDVLSGVVGSLIAQGYAVRKAAPLAAYLHGEAGDCMVKETGKAGLMASDIVHGLRKIFSCRER